MNPTNIEQLRDIHGLDPIPWWPLAFGWWLVAAGIFIALGIALAIALRIRKRDWRRDARQRLLQLGTRLHQLGAKEAAGQLSELLRRIGIALYGRTACASLTDNAWLAWLTAHDPAGFPWLERGRVLIDLPYAPPCDQLTAGVEPDQLRVLVNAVQPWLVKSLVVPQSRGR